MSHSLVTEHKTPLAGMSVCRQNCSPVSDPLPHILSGSSCNNTDMRTFWRPRHSSSAKRMAQPYPVTLWHGGWLSWCYRQRMNADNGDPSSFRKVANQDAHHFLGKNKRKWPRGIANTAACKKHTRTWSARYAMQCDAIVQFLAQEWEMSWKKEIKAMEAKNVAWLVGFVPEMVSSTLIPRNLFCLSVTPLRGSEAKRVPKSESWNCQTISSFGEWKQDGIGEVDPIAKAEVESTPSQTLYWRCFWLRFQLITRTESKVKLVIGWALSPKITPGCDLGLSMVMFFKRMLR